MKRHLPLLALIALALSVPSFAVAAYAGKSSAHTVAAAPAAVKLTIKSDTQHGKQDAKGVWHDAYLPAAFSVKPGQKVTVTVTNFDPSPHTFTAPGLKLSFMIAAAKGAKPAATTFTFTAPTKPGSFDWFCAAGCDPWAMSHLGFMRGRVTVAA
jgi:plastocyanin